MNETPAGDSTPRSRRLRMSLPQPRMALLVATCVVAFTAMGIHAAVSEPAVKSSGLELLGQMTLVNSEDFAGPAGAPPNPKLWHAETGGGGWGNHESQVYTNSPDNLRLDGNGHLVIEARRAGDLITSARISTVRRFDFDDGMIQARIKMPRGTGIHPAFWMLGSSLPEVGYPAAGEIDIVETVGKDGISHAAVHGPGDPSQVGPQGKWKLSADSAATAGSDDFHTYWLRKGPGYLTVGVDDQAYATFHRDQVPTGGTWVQDQPFFLLLNVAVGGDWPGPVAKGALPAEMLVDWIRIYK